MACLCIYSINCFHGALITYCSYMLMLVSYNCIATCCVLLWLFTQFKFLNYKKIESRWCLYSLCLDTFYMCRTGVLFVTVCSLHVLSQCWVHLFQWLFIKWHWCRQCCYSGIVWHLRLVSLCTFKYFADWVFWCFVKLVRRRCCFGLLIYGCWCAVALTTTVVVVDDRPCITVSQILINNVY